jgi:hypothetical protein
VVPAGGRNPLLNFKLEEHFNNQADKKLRGAFAAGGIDISAHGITQAHLETMDTLAKQVQVAYVAYCAAAEETEQALDEFLCPVPCDLMVDPVLLPTSGQTMERASLERYLLSDECDPINRKHLTMDMGRLMRT